MIEFICKAIWGRFCLWDFKSLIQYIIFVQLLSLVWFCDPKDCSMPVLFILHYLFFFYELYMFIEWYNKFTIIFYSITSVVIMRIRPTQYLALTFIWVVKYIIQCLWLGCLANWIFMYVSNILKAPHAVKISRTLGLIRL